jgi:hypothetical protein
MRARSSEGSARQLAIGAGSVLRSFVLHEDLEALAVDEIVIRSDPVTGVAISWRMTSGAVK